MTADIAHDLRTPLSVLHGYTEAMSEGKLDGNPEIYAVMHQQAKHLNYLIDDLRTLSLLDSGELSIQIQDVDPATILGQTMAAFKPIAKEKGIKLTQEIDEGLPRVKLDPDRLTQILGNLITNAFQVLSPGGKVILSLSTQAEDLVIQVSDNGPGINDEDLPHIFDRFYKSDKSRASDQGSSGLGLAITKKLVETLNGSVSVDSEPGKGTRFTILFPLHL
jgi:signal transduction histidine kinase